MSWLSEICENLSGKEDLIIVNDSKTPSGKAHVGSLRGVIVHDAVYRYLRNNGYKVKYTFGVDDYDPMDEIPYGLDYYYDDHLGKPLCNVPSPPGSSEHDIASHYINEFFKIFDELNVDVDKYYLRDIYRSGEFNEAIDIILSNVSIVREIYLKVSGSKRPDNWYPFQVICDNCGKIGTTTVIDYDGKEVVYECKKDMVSWAKGCGYKGKKSPYNGNGKLPWKLEWTAKWAYRGVSIEGAGTDHNTKGGSRDVASQCLRRIFDKQPPLNIPYGFFMLEGKKMSSSKGIGATARDMADFLPPEILRFLMFGSHPKRKINFAPDEKYITKLFNDFDRLKDRCFNDPKISEYEKSIYSLSQVNYYKYYFVPEFTKLVTLVQLPHKKVDDEVAAMKGDVLNGYELENLKHRINAAKYWIDNIASEDDKIEVKSVMPESYMSLNEVQKAFLVNLRKEIEFRDWDESELQAAVFSSARSTPIDQKMAFIAFYNVFLGKDKGPKAGNLIYYLGKDFVLKRLLSVTYNIMEFWVLTAIQIEDFELWLKDNLNGIIKIDVVLDYLSKLTSDDNNYGMGVVEFMVSMNDGRRYMKRIILVKFDGIMDANNELTNYKLIAREYIQEIVDKYQIPLQVESGLNDINLN